MPHLDSSAPPSPEAPIRRAPSLGRRVGIALFWLLALYVIGGAALSILPALYWPEHAPRPPRSLACARDLDVLERELAAHAAGAFGHARLATRKAWLSQWDRRYSALGSDCGPLEGARRDLGALRVSLGAWLDEHERGSERIRARFRRAVDAFLPIEPAEKS